MYESLGLPGETSSVEPRGSEGTENDCSVLFNVSVGYER